ncbi:MAG: cysteine desulfurase family protein [Acidimicrobiaceae bacterium]|nr:cysteine desulfurase family protein [Acidimicrobiaceae bacterium]
MSEVYLDYNASAPLDPRVMDAMVPVLRESVGNASSVHRFGRRQAAAVNDARDLVSALVGGRASGVVFTSGATEANNLALRGAVDFAVAANTGKQRRQRILISAVEHSSVSQTAGWLSDRGLVKLDVIGVTEGGYVDSNVLVGLLDDDVLLVSVMAANSETGVLNPITEIAEHVRTSGAILHCDATQIVGRLPFDMNASGADLVSVSSHKICGPGGVGALIGTHRALQQLEPVLYGGGHERGLRSGSLNVAGIVGFGEAARLAMQEQEQGLEAIRVSALRDSLVERLQSNLAGVSQNGDTSRRLPNTASIRFEGADAEAVVVNMDPIAASTGSACNAGSIEPSEVLLAMGLSRETAFESIRFSLGRFTTEADISTAVESVAKAITRVRALKQV